MKNHATWPHVLLRFHYSMLGRKRPAQNAAVDVLKQCFLDTRFVDIHGWIENETVDALMEQYFARHVRLVQHTIPSRVMEDISDVRNYMKGREYRPLAFYSHDEDSAQAIIHAQVAFSKSRDLTCEIMTLFRVERGRVTSMIEFGDVGSLGQLRCQAEGRTSLCSDTTQAASDRH